MRQGLRDRPPIAGALRRYVMRRPIILLLFVLAAAPVTSCRKSTSAPAEPVRSPGVTYEVRGEGGAITRGVTQSGSFTAGKNTLEFKGGRVIGNGKDRGSVKEGDSILLDAGGQLFVNGEKRSSD